MQRTQNKILKTVLPVVIICLYFTSGFAAEKHALLIGITDYGPTPDFDDLKGPQNDVKIMQKLLKNGRFKFDHVSVLLNEEATHSRIEKAFNQLADQSKSGKVKVVYIYYSGHGSKTKDLNGDEAQLKDLKGNLLPSYDQTWVTFGSRCPKKSVACQNFAAIDNYDILDDEISAWLNKIAAGCDQVVFVSDSCHSGSVSRKAVTDGIRRGPVDPREHPLGRKKYNYITLKNVIRIGASKDSEMAGEFTPQGTTDQYGVFTWYWVKALSKCSPEDSWSHVFNRAAQVMDHQTPYPQVPQISGAVAMKIFEADFLSYDQSVSVYEVLNNGDEKRLRIAAGSLTGVTKGSIYTVKGHIPKSKAPKVTITQVNPTSSTAKTDGDVNVYDQLVEVSHQYEFTATRLLLVAEHVKDRGKALKDVKKVISKQNAYAIIDDPKTCDLMVYLFRPTKSHLSDNNVNGSVLKQPPPSDGNAPLQIWILDRNGSLYRNNLRHSYTREGLTALDRNLKRLARVKDMMQVVSLETKSPLEISVIPMVPATEKKNASCLNCITNQWPTKACPFKYYQQLEPLSISEFVSRKWDLCTMLRFNAKNPTHRPYYFYVVYIGNQAEIVPIYPSIQDQSEIAEVDPGSQSIKGNASFRLDTRTMDYYKLIVSSTPINHHLFYQAGVKAVVRNASHLSPLERIISNAASGNRSNVSYKAGSWYAETIAIDMR
ncbi:MAG: caspase family protein [Desulfobacteraceae bacterium]|jgi:hypothetical protein